MRGILAVQGTRSVEGSMQIIARGDLNDRSGPGICQENGAHQARQSKATRPQRRILQSHDVLEKFC